MNTEEIVQTAKQHRTRIIEYVTLLTALVGGAYEIDKMFVTMNELRIETANLRIEIQDEVITRSTGVLARYSLDLTPAERMAVVQADLERALEKKSKQQELLERLRSE